ncbi:DUF2336 domain-containing protein [Henriciella marina]|uniref:DUF2336 domain-containing protein n=1 Tax=Henriciella marina TaxID=453851 RepID=UPI0003780049|nr:DUF2336 domain-containing protein [Henriciella marina]
MSDIKKMPEAIQPRPEGSNGGRARRLLLRRLIDFVALPATSVAPQDRSMGGDILLEMLFHASVEDREFCARRLQLNKEAPRRLMRYLAMADLDVARPILEANEGFDAADLATIADQTTIDHRLLIANRKRIDPCVAEALCVREEAAVLKALVVNKGADISETGMDMLVQHSRKIEGLPALLIKRLELIPSQAMAMFWWADGATRRTILQRQAADRLELVDLCSDVFAVAAEENWQDPVARKTLQLIERRQRNRAAIKKSPFDSLEHAIEVAAEKGLTPHIAQEIGFLSGVKPVTIAKILSDPGGEGLAVLCKATGLKRPYLAHLWHALRRPMEIDDGTVHPQFAYMSETYELLAVAKAQTTLRYWNWSLSSSYSPGRAAPDDPDATDSPSDSRFSTSRRTAHLVFGE